MRALPPPLGLSQLEDTEWQVGSSRSLPASRKPTSLPKVVVAAGSSLALSLLKLVPDAAAAAAAAAAITAVEQKLHTRREGGRSVAGRETGESTCQPPRSEKPSFCSGGHSEYAQSQPVSRKPKSGPRPLFPFSSVCSHCLGGGGVAFLPWGW